MSQAWIDWDPAANDGLVFRAEAAAKLGDSRQAADFLGRVSDDYRGVLQALAFRGEILFGDLNLPYEAEQTWQRMLEINEHADLARQRLIYFYSMTLQRQKMLAHIHKGIELGCEPPEAYAYLLLANNLNFTDGVLVTQKWRANYPDDQRLEVAQAVYAGKSLVSSSSTVLNSSSV